MHKELNSNYTYYITEDKRNGWDYLLTCGKTICWDTQLAALATEDSVALKKTALNL